MDSPKFALLTQGLEESLAGRKEEARRTLASLRERLDVDADPEDMQYLIFAAALSKRLGEVPAEDFHLYLRRFELPQISLFNLLALRLPTVSLAGTIANELLTDFIRGHDTVTLLDVGIGNGRQQVTLLHTLAEVDALPKQLTLVGVEPSEDSLRAAEDSLVGAARRLGVALRFVGIPRGAEELSQEDWAQLEKLPGPRIVNAAFALHHIAERTTGNVDLRESFFRRLREWSPDGVVLCEPNSDHHRVPIRQRFRNCWHHFGLTFKLIEELDTSRQEKNAMKLFFSREIEDIVGTQDEVRRYERHEQVQSWLGRLSRSGFTLADGLQRVARAQELVSVRPYNGYVGLEYQDEALVSVICATSTSKPV